MERFWSRHRQTMAVCGSKYSDTGRASTCRRFMLAMGSTNLVERLDSLFGEKARLNVFRRNSYSVVEMILPRV